MIYIVITLFLVIVFILNRKSKNDFFFQDEEIIKNKLSKIIVILSDFGISEYDIKKLKSSFEYFIKNPKEYNGTSIINDFWLIKGLEPESVIHDYDWIMAKSLKDLLKSNKEYCQRLRKRNAQWLWVWVFIFTGLTIVSIIKSLKYGISTSLFSV